MSHSRASALIAIVVLALTASTLAACGGGHRDRGTTEAHRGGIPLRIGLIVNKTGKLLSGEENSVPVMEAWARAVNAGGGVAGRPVDIVVADTKGDAPTATAVVRKLVKDETVVAAVLFDAGTEALVAGDITKAGLPVIGGMGYAPNAWGAMPNWLPLTTSIPSIFTMGMMLGKRLGGTRTALTICAEIAGCGAAEPVVKKASQGLGMRYTGTYRIAAAAPDYTAECLRIVRSGVDYVMLGAATAGAALRVAADCRTQGYGGAWGLFGGVIVPKVMREDDPGVRLGLAVNSFPWFADAAPVRRYRETMAKQGVGESVWGDPHSTAAYATMELLRKTLDAGARTLPADPGRRDIVRAYGSIHDETLGGLLPQPITFRPDRPQALVTCYWFGSYDRGRFTDGDLAHPVCDPPSLRPAVAS